jgi:hypothetical protein
MTKKQVLNYVEKQKEVKFVVWEDANFVKNYFLQDFRKRAREEDYRILINDKNKETIIVI